MKLISLLLLFLIFSFFYSYDQTFAASSPIVDLHQLTFSGQREDWPMIYKDRVYWSESTEIRGYNFKNNQYLLLATVGEELHSDFFAPIAYDGRYLIYDTYTLENNYDVHAYDFIKNQDIAVTEDLDSNTTNDYDNNTIVYIKGGACGSLHAFDLNIKEDALITETACGPAKISGNIIVWNYAASGGTNVYGYDLKKHEQFDIATENGFQSSPDIYGNNVVWIHSDGSYNSIRLKNIKTGETHILTESTEHSFSWPSMSKSYVVWGKNTAQHISGVEGANLKTGEVFEIQEQGPHQNDNLSAIVVDNIVAWMAWRTGNGDIYAATLLKH